MTRLSLVFVGLFCASSSLACGGSSFETTDPFAVSDAAEAGAPDGNDAASDGGKATVDAADASDGAADAGSHADAAPPDGGEPDANSPDAALPTCVCGDGLSDVGTGAFAIAFTLETSMHPTTPGFGALLNQVLSCDSAHPGWQVWLNENGTIQVEIWDGSSGGQLDSATTAVAVNDGVAHQIVISRSAAGTELTLSVDKLSSSVMVAAEDLVGALASLEVGVEPVCSGNAAAPPEPLVGTVSGVCVGACH